MKFGKHILSQQALHVTLRYLDYGRLKTILKQLVRVMLVLESPELMEHFPEDFSEENSKTRSTATEEELLFLDEALALRASMSLSHFSLETHYYHATTSSSVLVHDGGDSNVSAGKLWLPSDPFSVFRDENGPGHDGCMRRGHDSDQDMTVRDLVDASSVNALVKGLQWFNATLSRELNKLNDFFSSECEAVLEELRQEDFFGLFEEDFLGASLGYVLVW